MHDPDRTQKIRLRSVFVSDVHLGSRDCRASGTAEVPRIDRSRLSISGRRHRRLLEPSPLLLLAAKRTTKCCARFSPWQRTARRSSTCRATTTTNIREFCGSLFGNVSIRRRYVHATADGREFLVMHGDEFDSAVKCSRWLARFGATAYEFMMRINRGVNLCRRALGLPHWSLATYLKLRLANAVRYVEAFEHAAAHAALQPQPRGHRVWPYPPAGAAARSTACSTATMATGSRAARRSSRTMNGELSLVALGKSVRHAGSRRAWSRSPPDASVQLRGIA